MNRALPSSLFTAAVCLVVPGCATTSTRQANECAGCCVIPLTSTSTLPLTAGDIRALQDALADERRSQAFYDGVIARHGDVRPFVNIAGAERRHEQAVVAMMKSHDILVPSTKPSNIPAVAGTIRECAQVAAQVERDNIALYDRVLAGVTAPDVRQLLLNLQAASRERHLPVFERWSANTRPSHHDGRVGRNG